MYSEIDEIGRYCYPVDIHVINNDKEEYERFREEYQQKLRYKKGESYGIPYRSLIPVSFKNVLVAGRCIGTDRQMQASVRVMPGCFITGQAAGVAASLACETENVRKISVKKLQENLIKLGAYIPNIQSTPDELL
ncbi:MAG: FAD-dependent oxidoreductase [Clostridia bacterium]|nr:FAD-dependent oxidoreductase [Clostridia bacterium]